MSIASEITRLQGVKSDILAAIADKGVTVPADSALDDCPALIGDIEQGGGNVITIGGEDYGFVRIGNLLWTTRNLNLPVTHSVANDSHPEYGRYYGLNTGFATEVEAQLTDGWRVPTSSDFKNLCNSFNTESSGAWNQVAYILRNSNWTDLQGAKQGVNSVGFAANQYGRAYVQGGNTSFLDMNGAMFASKEGYYALALRTGTDTAYVNNSDYASNSSYLSVRLCCIPYTKEKIGDKTYRCVKMPDGKIWMAENLDFKFEGCGIGGTTDPGTSPHAWYYNNNESTFGWNGNKYGLLYNWYATKYLDDNKSTLIPGWHVPTFGELQALKDALGSSSGTKLKSTSNWYNSNNGTDNYGFSGVPTGIVNPGSNPMFDYYQKITTYQCITPYGTNSKFGMALNENSTDAALSYNFGYPQGNSIRLVKD